jgi:hypothetical protein
MNEPTIQFVVAMVSILAVVLGIDRFAEYRIRRSQRD